MLTTLEPKGKKKSKSLILKNFFFTFPAKPGIHNKPTRDGRLPAGPLQRPGRPIAEAGAPAGTPQREHDGVRHVRQRERVQGGLLQVHAGEEGRRGNARVGERGDDQRDEQPGRKM